MENRQMTPFFICIFNPSCLGNLLLHLKIVKIHFHGVPPLAHSGLENTSILKVKAVTFGFCSFRFRKHTN